MPLGMRFGLENRFRLHPRETEPKPSRAPHDPDKSPPLDRFADARDDGEEHGPSPDQADQFTLFFTTS